MSKPLTCYLTSEDYHIVQSHMLRQNVSQREVCKHALEHFLKKERVVYACLNQGMLYRGQVDQSMYQRIVKTQVQTGAHPMDVLYSAIRVYIRDVLKLCCVSMVADPKFVALFAQATEFALDRALQVHAHEVSAFMRTLEPHPSGGPSPKSTYDMMSVVLSTRHLKMLPQEVVARTQVCRHALTLHMSGQEMLGQIPCTCSSTIHLELSHYKRMKILIEQDDYPSMSAFFEAALGTYLTHHMTDWWVRREHEVRVPNALERQVSVMVSEHTHRRVRRLAVRQGQSLRLLYSEAITDFLEQHIPL